MRHLAIAFVLLVAACPEASRPDGSGANVDAAGVADASSDAGQVRDSNRADGVHPDAVHGDAAVMDGAAAIDHGAASDHAAASDHTTAADHATSPDGGPPADIWVTAYLASWNLYVEPGGNWGNLPPDQIDFTAFSHLIFFALGVESDGALSGIGDWQNFNSDRLNAIIPLAHSAGKPILFSVGGAGNHDTFAAAIAGGATRAALVDNLISILTTWGFDGIDLDLEPINSGDEANFQALVNALSTRLASLTTPLLDRPLLTAAVGPASAFAPVHDKFDQINLMTYDMSGAWDGWVTWYNAPIYNGGWTFPSTSGPLPCADLMVDEFVSAGIPASKLGIGIDFYGYVWRGGGGAVNGGVTGPRQGWTTAPSVVSLSYHEIMFTYFSSGVYHWDDVAKAAYLSTDEALNQNDRFISLDDENTAAAKVTYVRQKEIGGMIIWELAGGYRSDQNAGQRDGLLQSLKQAWYSGQ